MKVVFFATTILEHGGGLEKYFIETAKSFAEFPNIKADIVTMDDNFTYKITDLLSIYYFKKIKRKSLYNEALNTIKQRLGKANYYKCKNLKELKEKLNEYDVIYSKNEVLEAFIFKFFIRYKNLPPIIFGVHTPHFYPMAESLQAKIHNLLYGTKIYNFLTNGVSTFHVINSADEKRLKKQLGTRDIKKIYNPFDFNRFRMNANKYKYNFKFDENKFNIIWLGRLTEQKGVQDLIKIIDELNPTLDGKVIWNIIGEGTEKDKIIKLKGKWENINYFGHIENKYIPSIMGKNDLFILTSKWEAFPYTIIEAQAMNLPVISYNIPGSQDIIKNNVNGFLVKNIEDFESTITNFIDGKSRLKIKDFNSYVSAKFDPDLIYNDLLELFKNAKAN